MTRRGVGDRDFDGHLWRIELWAGAVGGWVGADADVDGVIHS